MRYVAYGSNMNLEQMAYRCPTAKVVGVSMLHDYELNFKGRMWNCHATIDPKKGSEVPVVIWEIDGECEKSLDWYEGFPSYYRKETVKVDGEDCMVYIMNGGKFGYPSGGYLDVIAQGYEDNGIDLQPLEDAVNRVIQRVGVASIAR